MEIIQKRHPLHFCAEVVGMKLLLSTRWLSDCLLSKFDSDRQCQATCITSIYFLFLSLPGMQTYLYKCNLPIFFWIKALIVIQDAEKG